MGELDGKVAIVTGAAAGIGRATALRLAAEGARLGVADLDEERGAALVAEVEAAGSEAVFVRTDVSDEAQVDELVARTVERFGRLDIGVNNAGIEGETAAIADQTTETWQRVMAVNATGVFLCMRAQIPHLLAAGGGSIVNISSVAGLQGFAGSTPYVASKHAVIGMTKVAALDYATAGIRVNAICPGVIATDMITRVLDEHPEMEPMLTGMEPVGRLGRPDEIADAVVWLCSDRSSFVTGHPLVVDGGQQAG
ncbi:MAG: SDR family oxidoreductase [Acidimicrobiales bacterium]|nr:SDR family oxidoreductase [Acidimicrobiales bacterium]